MPLLLGSFALTAYAGVRLLDRDAAGVVLWLVGAAVLHDLVLLPLYAAADRALRTLAGRRRPRRPGPEAGPEAGPGPAGHRADPAGGAGAEPRTAGGRVNHIRVPALFSGLLLLVWWPLITGPPDCYTAATGLDGEGFGRRWLLVTAALFAVSAGWALVSAVRGRAAGPGRRDAAGRRTRVT
ncbi:hypothetical protein [Streptomyces zingiberis]|uniref:Lipoprotein n=1 Tax=Streptomyces zingiberis TaxID=2053010 RepID=A0ABX1BVC2_9ACTN|nr:hypothetical protein [Streptomyces zingiberis]NJQ01652.1 hypothetical protein [Streptomyces zingiberis]